MPNKEERFKADKVSGHPCCWGAVVDTSKVVIGDQYGMVCECANMEEAEWIAAALNAFGGKHD